MKSQFLLIMSACLLQLVSPDIIADNWSQYQQIMSNYYTFDNQNFAKISCRLQVQPLTEIVEKMRQLSSLKPGDLKISDTLASYTIMLDKTNGVSFNNPTLNIEMLSEKGMANPALVKRGIQETTEGFNRQVAGVDQQLKGIFEVYRKDKPGEITINKITKTAQGYAIEFEQNNMVSKSIIQDNHMSVVSKNAAMSIKADSYFVRTAIDNKLLLQRYVMVVKQPTGMINATAALKYQKLGTILFPENIQEHENFKYAGIQTVLPISVHFSNCKVR